MSSSPAFALRGLSQKSVTGSHWWHRLALRWKDRLQRRDGNRLQGVQDQHVRSLLASHAGVRLAAILSGEGDCLSVAMGSVERLPIEPTVADEIYKQAVQESNASWMTGHAATPIFSSALGNALCRRVDLETGPLVLLLVLDPRVGVAHATWLGRYAAKELRCRLGLA